MAVIKKPSMDDTTLPALGAGGGEGRGMRVLVAQDERDTLMTLGILLRSEKFEVRLLLDGPQVLNEVEAFKPHAVILDIGMPGRNGYDVASDIRAAHGPQSPVLIALTAHSSAADKERARSSGFHHHVAKPYDPIRLLELLAAVRGGSRDSSFS
jgi:CheY-like chemotaxis protein